MKHVRSFVDIEGLLVVLLDASELLLVVSALLVLRYLLTHCLLQALSSCLGGCLDVLRHSLDALLDFSDSPDNFLEFLASLCVCVSLQPSLNGVLLTVESVIAVVEVRVAAVHAHYAKTEQEDDQEHNFDNKHQS